MRSQQRWYWLLSFFNNKINFLFSCEIRSWSLHFRQFDVCQLNTAQSNALVHSIVTNKWAKLGAKIFRNFWDIAIFVFGYFILPHPVILVLCYINIFKIVLVFHYVLKLINKKSFQFDHPFTTLKKLCYQQRDIARQPSCGCRSVEI